jgi:DNA-binding transcriptional ArsR family regulator
VSALDDCVPALEKELAALDDRRGKIVAALNAIRLVLGVPLPTLAASVAAPPVRSTKALDGVETSILEFLKERPEASISEIIEGTRYSKPTVYRRLTALVDNKQVEMHGTGRGRRYALPRGRL